MSGNQAPFSLSANAISGLIWRISDVMENAHKGRYARENLFLRVSFMLKNCEKIVYQTYDSRFIISPIQRMHI